MNTLALFMPFVVLFLVMVIVLLVLLQLRLKRKVNVIQKDFDKLRLDMLQVRHVLRKKGFLVNKED